MIEKVTSINIEFCYAGLVIQVLHFTENQGFSLRVFPKEKYFLILCLKKGVILSVYPGESIAFFIEKEKV
jgi:hypothetical protein